MKQEVLSNEEVAPDIFRMAISAWGEVQGAHPGQFVHIRCSSLHDPLLRRPFSIHELNREEVMILYRVVGRGTALLSRMKSGQHVDIIGPLGSGFRVRSSGGTVMVVAGGMGVAPLVFLAQFLGKIRKKVLIGARTKELVLCEKELKNLGCLVEVATDDGSYGQEGYVSALFTKVLQKTKPEEIYACGPDEMVRKIAITSSDHHIPCQVSFENQMACGVGACLGCVIRINEPDGGFGYRRVCKEGPVFDANVVSWENFEK